MVEFTNSFGNKMLVADYREEEYKKAGFIPANSSSAETEDKKPKATTKRKKGA